MRVLNVYKKNTIIKLFLRGFSYDEIVVQTGVSKGSVVSIIKDFREGKLRLPPDMSEHVDALRQVAVDLRTSNTTVNQLESFLKIHSKLKQMGVRPEQVDDWLETCQSIASSPVATNTFVAAALELAKLTAKNRMSYPKVIEDYEEKSGALKSIDESLAQGRNELKKLSLEIEQSAVKLDSMNNAITEGKEDLRRQKVKLKSQERAYLAERKLTEKKVKLIEATVNSGFRSSGLAVNEVESLRKQIITVGSITRVIECKKKQRAELQSQVDDLKVYQQHYYNQVCKLASSWQGMELAIARKERERGELDAELKAKEQEIMNRIEDIYLSHIIIGFLVAPGKITAHDFDRLVEMMIALRQKRLGIGPKQVTDANGKLVCRCQTPTITTDLEKYEVDADWIREKFAFSLEPLFRDKFVSKLRHDLSNIDHQTKVKIANLQGIVEGLQLSK